jgi:hypothetical protein
MASLRVLSFPPRGNTVREATSPKDLDATRIALAIQRRKMGVEGTSVALGVTYQPSVSIQDQSTKVFKSQAIQQQRRDGRTTVRDSLARIK